MSLNISSEGGNTHEMFSAIDTLPLNLSLNGCFDIMAEFFQWSN